MSLIGKYFSNLNVKILLILWSIISVIWQDLAMIYQTFLHGNKNKDIEADKYFWINGLIKIDNVDKLSLFSWRYH